MKQRLASAALALLLLLCAAESALADTAAATTMKLEAATGTVTVKNASGVAQTVRDGMRLYNGYSLSTAAASEAYISLDSSKAVKLGPSGKVQVKQAGKQLEISVSAGELFFNVAAPLKTDESLNVRTSTMVTGVRGSFGWVKPGETGLMHGSVILTRPGGGPGATLSSGQLARADAKPAAITAADVPTLVAREMRDNPELLAQVQRDAPSVDVAELMDTLDARIAREREAEQAAQTALEARQAAQTPANSGRNSSSGSRSSSSSGSSGYTPQVPPTPDTPQVPDNPDTPQVPDTPDTPQVPDNPDTPQVPDNPDTPQVPDTPDTPEVPDTPDNPDTPDTPQVPDTPDTPDTPEVPDTPDTPDTPEVPDNPGNPDTPEVPDNPGNPDTPEVPDTPDTPQVPDTPDTPQVPDNPDTPQVPDNPDTPQVPDTPDIPDKPDVPDAYTVTFRVPDGALLTILYDLSQDGLQQVSDTQTVELPRGVELYLYLSRPDTKNNTRVSVPFRVLVDGKHFNAASLRVTHNMTVEVAETGAFVPDSQFLRRLSVTVAVPAAYRDSYGDSLSMSFTPDAHNVITLPAFLTRLPRFAEWETKILPRRVTVSMELADGASAFPAAQSLATVRDCYDLARKGLIVTKDSASAFYAFRFDGDAFPFWN